MTNEHETMTLFPNMSSCRSLDYARGHKSIRIFNDLCKQIEIYIYARKKHPFASNPAAKHPNAANSGLKTYDKKPVNLFTVAARGPAITLQT